MVKAAGEMASVQTPLDVLDPCVDHKVQEQREVHKSAIEVDFSLETHSPSLPEAVRKYPLPELSWVSVVACGPAAFDRARVLV